MDAELTDNQNSAANIARKAPAELSDIAGRDDGSLEGDGVAVVPSGLLSETESEEGQEQEEEGLDCQGAACGACHHRGCITANVPRPAATMTPEHVSKQ